MPPTAPVSSQPQLIDRPPSGDLVLAPAVEAAVQSLLQQWAATPHARDYPLTGARIEPSAIHLTTGSSAQHGEVVLTHAPMKPWFSIAAPDSWPSEALDSLRAELARAFPANPWAVAGRAEAADQGERAALLARDQVALAQQAILGPPARVPTVSASYAAVCGAVFVGLAVVLTLKLLLRRR